MKIQQEGINTIYSFETRKEAAQEIPKIMQQYKDKAESLGFCPKLNMECKVSCVAYQHVRIVKIAIGTMLFTTKPAFCNYNRMFPVEG